MINKEIIIKHLDILLKNIDDITQFDINGIMTKYGDFKHNIPEQNQNFVRICQSVKRLGKTYKYFDSEKGRPDVYFLMEDGIKAKEFGSHLKYQKSLNENRMTLFQKIYLVGFFIFGVSTILLGVRNNSLKTDYNSLKYQSQIYKDSIVELKGQIELYKSRISNDTLQTKSLNDLKTD